MTTCPPVVATRMSARFARLSEGRTRRFSSGQESPGHSGHFVGRRHAGPMRATPVLTPLAPPTPGVGGALQMPSHRPRSMNEELSHVAVAPFAQPQQGGLAASRILLGHQTSPRRQLPAILAAARSPHGGHQGGRRQRPETPTFRQALTRLIGRAHLVNLVCGGLHLLVDET